MKRLNTVRIKILCYQLVNVLRKPECKIILKENPSRHRHKIVDYKKNVSKRYITFFTDEDIEGNIELKFKKPNFEHNGIRAELHGIIEKYNVINSSITEFCNLGIEILRPGKIEEISPNIPFSFKNTKLLYESYKGLYAQVKYYIKIIINANLINYTYEEEFAVVNPNDDCILMENDDNIYITVGIQNLLSIDFELEHINYNCRGTIKGLVSFNYIHLPIKYVEIQLLKNEIVFAEKNNKEPIIIEDIELIDGSPIKNDTVPFRIFLKSYNLTPTYKNINNIFCVKYYINLIIGDYENNTFFKQKEIKLFRIYKVKKNPELNYGPWEEFISEPIYNEEYFQENKNNKENEKDSKDSNLKNIFNDDEDNDMEEEEYEEEEDDESEENQDREEKLDNINLISNEFIENKKEENKINKKKKKYKKSNIVNILRSNSLYMNEKKIENSNNINNIENDNIISFNEDNEEDNKYMNSLINSNFPTHFNNNLFNDESYNYYNNININNNSNITNNNNENIIKFDD